MISPHLRIQSSVAIRHPAAALFQKVIFEVTGIHCLTCAATLEGALRELPGVRLASVYLVSERVEVAYDASVISDGEIMQAVESARVHVLKRASARSHAVSDAPSC